MICFMSAQIESLHVFIDLNRSKRYLHIVLFNSVYDFFQLRWTRKCDSGLYVLRIYVHCSKEKKECHTIFPYIAVLNTNSLTHI